tara:strand:+ start:45422 stop:45808 length:387 start_codon:yes stop_codon:yes gene_type:complete
LWLLKFIGQKRSRKYLISAGIFNAALLFVHAYLGVISISILITHFLIDGAYNEFKNSNSWSILGSVFFSLIPFLTVKAFSDVHEFRIDNTYGFLEYYADFDTVLLPNHGAFKDFIFNQLPSFGQIWEG